MERILDVKLESQLPFTVRNMQVCLLQPCHQGGEVPKLRGESLCVRGREADRQTTAGLVEVGQLQPVAKLRLHSLKGENCPFGRNAHCISSRRVQYILVLTSVIFFTSLYSKKYKQANVIVCKVTRLYFSFALHVNKIHFRR